MSYDPSDDLHDLRISYPRDYDPYAPIHIGIEIPDGERDEPPCPCEDGDCAECA